MSRKSRENELIDGPTTADNGTTATVETAPPADPQPNGEQPTPQPARTGRKKRDPDAPRPLYLMVAMDRQTRRLRVIGTEPTIGRARKAMPNAVYGIRDTEDGPMILRSRPVE